jgi:hypothetical protein
MAFWVAVAGVVVSVVAAGVSTYAAYEQGQTAQANAKFNQKMAQRAADQKRLEAEAAAQRKQKENDALKARTRALIGGTGTVAGEGSSLLIEMEQADQAALDEANIRYVGEVGAGDLEGESILLGYQGKRAARSGYIGAGASLLSGASSAASQYGTLRKNYPSA